MPYDQFGRPIPGGTPTHEPHFNYGQAESGHGYGDATGMGNGPHEGYRQALLAMPSAGQLGGPGPVPFVRYPFFPTAPFYSTNPNVGYQTRFYSTGIQYTDPDYSVVLNYEARWDEIGSEGRLLALDGEYQHTNSDLAIGLGLSPEILIGEGMYSGNKIQMQLMEVSYVQFRDLLTGILEDQVFKPIAMEKGFYETDKYGRPRWIFPKVTFSRMALRDSGDLYDMLFNLYAKGSLPVDIIYEFLAIDPEDAKRKLEDNLFTVMDSKFNEMLSNIYNSVGEWLMTNTDLGKKLVKGLDLSEVDHTEDEEGPEGSGEGMA